MSDLVGNKTSKTNFHMTGLVCFAHVVTYCKIQIASNNIHELKVCLLFCDTIYTSNFTQADIDKSLMFSEK